MSKHSPILSGYEWRTPPKDIDFHYIINEVAHVEETMKNNSLVYDGDLTQAVRTIHMLARYFRNYKGFDKKTSETIIFNYMEKVYREKFDLAFTRLKTIEEACSTRRNTYNHGYKPLRDFDSIGITHAEIEKIQQLETVEEQELAFSILCFTKMYNETNRRQGRKINNLCYISHSVLRRCIGWKRGTDQKIPEMIYELSQKGFTNIIDNFDKYEAFIPNRQPLFTLQCLIVDPDGEEICQIDNFDTLNFTWRFLCGDKNIKKCECGRYFERKSNRQYKCPKCGGTDPKKKEKKPQSRNGKVGLKRRKNHQ